MYHLQFSLQADSPKTFVYTIVCHIFESITARIYKATSTENLLYIIWLFSEGISVNDDCSEYSTRNDKDTGREFYRSFGAKAHFVYFGTLVSTVPF
jgi:hypothetical protein